MFSLQTWPPALTTSHLFFNCQPLAPKMSVFNLASNLASNLLHFFYSTRFQLRARSLPLQNQGFSLQPIKSSALNIQPLVLSLQPLFHSFHPQASIFASCTLVLRILYSNSLCFILLQIYISHLLYSRGEVTNQMLY